jgi:hypothetical protein
MGDALLLAAIVATAYGGFALLALSQRKHWTLVAGPVACPRLLVWGFRAGGGALLAISFAVALWRDGVSFGALVWSISISVAATAVAFTLTWRPAWLRVFVVPRRSTGDQQ